MLTSLERVRLALEHREADRIALDLGGSQCTGMHVDCVYNLRQALQLDLPGTPVKVIDPFTMLGEVAPDLQDALGVDVVSLSLPYTMLGFRNEGWKPWTTFVGTPVLVPDKFNTTPEANGDILLYPEGDKSAPPSARMPRGGFYFDAVVRQDPIEDDHLNVEDNLEEFGPISDEDLRYLQCESERLAATGKAIMGNFGTTSFGDIALVPAMQLKHPKGIRDISEWYISTNLRRDYVYEVFDRQCDISIKNLEKIYAAVGNRVTVYPLTGTDFGAQHGPFLSPKAYVSLFKPFHKRVNDWVHTHTQWKTFMHCCGSIWRLLDEFVDAGFDILNPVQTSAAEMDPSALKARYGDRLTFWGGGVDTQRVLPFGTPQEVREMVEERIRIFGPGGGYVFNAIHDIQSGTPTENLLALFDAVKSTGVYPITQRA